jgi:hypothetical protein
MTIPKEWGSGHKSEVSDECLLRGHCPALGEELRQTRLRGTASGDAVPSGVRHRRPARGGSTVLMRGATKETPLESTVQLVWTAKL